MESPRPKRSTACDYCRRKKLRCDGEKPSCSNCQSRGLECVQHAPPQKPRPTNRRIIELEEENRRLQLRLREAQQGLSGNQGENDTPATTIELSTALGDDASRSLPESGRRRPSRDFQAHESLREPVPAEAPQINQMGYHGPTSALFDENPRDLRASSSPSRPDEYTKCILVAEAARQRHLEMINLAAGKLDFDGLDRETGMQLLSLYWTRQLHAGLIIYRPAFMRDMACGGPFFSKLLLNAMYYSVSKHSPCLEIRKDAGDRSTAGWTFRQRFEDLLRDCYYKSSITTIQALLIMASSLFTRCDERSASWLYAGNAFNMIIDLGLHVSMRAPQDSTPMEMEVRKRVFWSAYTVDKIQCLYQGRQPCLRISESRMSLSFADDYEETDIFDPAPFLPRWSYVAQPSLNVTLLKAQCELSVIMEHILHSVYATSRRPGDLQRVLDDSTSLKSELEAWRRGLPPELDLLRTKQDNTHPLPYNLSLLALYDVSVILTHRPIFSETMNSNSYHDKAKEALIACMAAAGEIAQILQMYERCYAPETSTFLLSYAAYISANFSVQVLSRGIDHGSLNSLKVCLHALEKHDMVHTAAKRAKVIIEALIARAHLNIGDRGAAAASLEQQDWTSPDGIASTLVQCDDTSSMAVHNDPPDVQGDYREPLGPVSGAPQWDLDLSGLDVDFSALNDNIAENGAEGWADLLQGPMFHDLYLGNGSLIA